MTSRLHSCVARILLLVVCIAAAADIVRAEVSARPHNDGRVATMVMGDVGITDGIDPIPQIWQQYSDLPPDWVLNPSGAERGDGRPDIAFHPNGHPVAVWSYARGNGFDIALSRWQGNGWSPIEFVTSTPQDELDPRLFLKADGTIYITWWVDLPLPRVELTARGSAEDLWATPYWITNLTEAGVRPSVAWSANSLWVAYERDATESLLNTREVAVRRQNQLDVFVLEYIADTEYDGAIDPVLHAPPGKFWMDWRFSEDQFAYAEINDPAGNGANFEPWTDASWIGIESIRLLIAGMVGTTLLPNEHPDNTGSTTP